MIPPLVKAYLTAWLTKKLVESPTFVNLAHTFHRNASPVELYNKIGDALYDKVVEFDRKNGTTSDFSKESKGPSSFVNKESADSDQDDIDKRVKRMMDDIKRKK